MHDKCFIDTNLLIYAVTESDKSETARQLLTQTASLVISVQVINEFINVCKRKKILPDARLYPLVSQLINELNPVSIDTQTLKTAIDIAQRYHYSTFDSLILASALQHNCTRLLSEDMHHGQVIDNKLTIINPFLTRNL
jgi:predicted nucleic acid-binding protein